MGQILRGRFRDRGTWIVIAVVVMAVSTIVVAVVRDRSNFAAATLTLSVISGNVEVVPDGGRSRRAADGEALAAGATVRTQAPDGRAVLTFRDGSTAELEPEARVKIEQLSLGTRGELLVRLRQERGRTWSHVQPLLSPSSRFHIKTPSATAVVRGTSFEVDVELAGIGAGLTRVAVFDGKVDLVAGGQVVPILAGHTGEVAEGSAPRAAQRLAPDGICMRIEVSSAGLITVTDPDGRSAGLTPMGHVSQIPRTVVSGPQTAPQSVDFFAPTAGDWEIGVVPRGSGGPFQLRVTTVAAGKIVDVRALAVALGFGERVVTNVRLDPDGRGGSFGAPVRTTETRAVALPSEKTTTAPIPMARLFRPEELAALSPEDLAIAPSCVSPDELERIGDVEPIGSSEKKGR